MARKRRLRFRTCHWLRLVVGAVAVALAAGIVERTDARAVGIPDDGHHFAGAIAGVIGGTAVGSVVPAGVAVSAFSELFFPITVHTMPAR